MLGEDKVGSLGYLASFPSDVAFGLQGVPVLTVELAFPVEFDRFKCVCLIIHHGIYCSIRGVLCQYI